MNINSILRTIFIPIRGLSVDNYSVLSGAGQQVSYGDFYIIWVLIRFIPTIRTAYVVNKRTGNYNLGLSLKEDTPLREGTFQAEELSKQNAGNVNEGRYPATLKFLDQFGVFGVRNRVFMLQMTKGKQLSTYPL